MEKERTLRDSVLVRWSALGIVAFTMMAAYFVNDIMAPLKTMLEANLDWTSYRILDSLREHIAF